MGYYNGGKTVTNGLILHLDASDINSYPGTGTTWFDLSGGGYNGTLTNGPSFNSLNGGCINFTADGQYVTINNSANTIFTPDNITLASWTRFTQNATVYHTLMAKWGNSNSYILYPNSTLSSPTQTTWNISNNAILSPSIPLDTWTYVVATYDRTLMKIYHNGVLQSSGSLTIALPASITQNLILGTNVAGTTGRTLRGYIATAVVYNRALNDNEIIQNYNAQKSRFGL